MAALLRPDPSSPSMGQSPGPSGAIAANPGSVGQQIQTFLQQLHGWLFPPLPSTGEEWKERLLHGVPWPSAQAPRAGSATNSLFASLAPLMFQWGQTQPYPNSQLNPLSSFQTLLTLGQGSANGALPLMGALFKALTKNVPMSDSEINLIANGIMPRGGTGGAGPPSDAATVPN